MSTMLGFGFLFREENYFKIRSRCPKCGSIIKRIKPIDDAIIGGIYPPTIRIRQLKKEVMDNPEISYQYFVECQNCGFTNIKHFTYKEIKRIEDK